jgi:hypothetical protein
MAQRLIPLCTNRVYRLQRPRRRIGLLVRLRRLWAQRDH